MGEMFTVEQETQIHRIADSHSTLTMVVGIVVSVFVAYLITVGNNRTTIYDLQRRVGQLEQQVRRLEDRR